MELTNIDTIRIKRYIAIVKKQLERTDKHAMHGQARLDNINLLKQYKQELDRRNNKTDEH